MQQHNDPITTTAGASPKSLPARFISKTLKKTRQCCFTTTSSHPQSDILPEILQQQTCVYVRKY